MPSLRACGTLADTINYKLWVVFQIENWDNELSGSNFNVHKDVDIKLTENISGYRKNNNYRDSSI